MFLCKRKCSHRQPGHIFPLYPFFCFSLNFLKNTYILKLDNSGKKKLAYDIQHERKGTFITVQFEGPSTVVAELERFQRMEDQVMKFMTVRVNPADLVVAAEPEEEETVDGGVQ